MCVVTPHRFPCGHQYGRTITQPCMHGRPYSSVEPATECLKHDYTPYPDPDVHIRITLPTVCPDCFRRREEEIFDEAERKIKLWQARMARLDARLRNNNPEALQPQDWQIAEDTRERVNREVAKVILGRERKLKKWRDDNGVWGDG